MYLQQKIHLMGGDQFKMYIFHITTYNWIDTTKLTTL
jgi:hypothetical protein